MQRTYPDIELDLNDRYVLWLRAIFTQCGGFLEIVNDLKERVQAFLFFGFLKSGSLPRKSVQFE